MLIIIYVLIFLWIVVDVVVFIVVIIGESHSVFIHSLIFLESVCIVTSLYLSNNNNNSFYNY